MLLQFPQFCLFGDTMSVAPHKLWSSCDGETTWLIIVLSLLITIGSTGLVPPFIAHLQQLCRAKQGPLGAVGAPVALGRR